MSYSFIGRYFDKYRRFFSYSCKDYVFNVNLQNGELLFTRKLIELSGKHMPLNLSLKYSQLHVNVYDNLNVYTGFPFGFKTNYHVILEYESNYDRYIYEDMDGFKHIFKLAVNSSTLYFDSMGSGLMLEATATGHRVFDDDGDYQDFDLDGRLTKIHEEITGTHYAEQTISYSSDFKISSITDSYGRVINFSYSNSAIQISYSNNVVITLHLNNNLLTKISKNIGNNIVIEDSISQSYYLTNITLNSGEDLTFSYTDEQLDHIITNINQDSFSFDYDLTSDRWATITNAEGISTHYEFNKSNSISQKTDTNTSVNLGYFNINSDIVSCMVKPLETDDEMVEFDFGNNSSSINTSSNSSGYSNYIASNYLKSKRMYLFIAEINGNLAQDTFEIQLVDFDNNLLAELVFSGSNRILSFPVCLCTDAHKIFRLYYNNKCPNSVEIVKAKIVPLIGEFELFATQVPGDGPIFFYDHDSYYLFSGREVRLINGNPASSLGYKVEYSDLIKNEKLFYKHNGLFHFWCNDQTQLIDNCTSVAYSNSIYDYVLFDSLSGKISFYGNDGNTDFIVCDLELYRIEGKDDNSISITKVSHDSSEFPMNHTSLYYEEEETCVVGGNNSITYYFYDDSYCLTDVIHNDGYQALYFYDAKGNLNKIQESHSSIMNDFVSEYAYDSNDNLVSKEELVGDNSEETTYEYDGFGNMSSALYPNSHRVSFDYDELTGERDLSVSYGDANQDSFTQYKNFIDDDNCSLSVEDACYSFSFTNGELTSVSYNNQQILSITHHQETASSGAIISKSETVTYSNGGSIYTEYDSFGRLFIKGICLYSYDDYSNLISITDGYYHQNNPAISYAYNYKNQVVEINQYNNLRATFEYDIYKRLINQTFYYNSVPPLYSVDFAYHDRADMAKVIKSTSIAYENNIVEIIDNVDAFQRITDQNVVFGYHFLKQEIEYCSLNGETNNFVKTVTHKDERTYPGEPIHFNPVLFAIPLIDTYSYDSVGNITSIVKRQLNATVESLRYQYDVFSRLTRENNSRLNKTITYEYDNKGNILFKKEYAYTSMGQMPSNPIAVHTYSYDQSYPDRLISFDNETFIYDSVGNPTTYRGKSMLWTKGTLLSQVYDGNEFINLTYDGLNQRVVKTVGNNVTDYKYIDGLLLIEERVNKTIKYLYSHRGVIGFVLSGFNDPVQSINIDGIYYFEKNLQQDVVSIRNANNQVVARYIYDAWGNHEVRNPDYSININANFIGNINPIRYRSYYYDADLKMYWLTTRYYDPEIGRFISPDHYSYLDYQKLHGINLYVYSKSNPIMYYDPSGHFALIALILGCTAILAGVGAAIGTRSLGTIAYYEAEETASSADKNPTISEDVANEFDRTYDGDGFTVHFKTKTKNNDAHNLLTVYDSWRYSKKEIEEFLNWLKQEYDVINVKRVLNEWIWHNLAYSKGIFIESSKNADIYFNAPDNKFGFIFDWFGFW